MANRRKNQETKAASTAERPDRNNHVEGQSLIEAPLPPLTLNPIEKAEWKRLALDLMVARILTAGDLRALETLCVALAIERKIREKADEGVIITNSKGMMTANPAVKLLLATQTQTIRMLAEFGLTPRDRQSIDKLEGGKQSNPFEGV